MASVEIHDSVDDLRTEWEELADRTQAPPCLAPAWIAAWWRAFGRGRLAILALRDGSELTGVLPMARTSGGLTSPANWHTPLFAPVAADATAVSELARALIIKAGSSVRLRFVDSEEPLLPAIRDAAAGQRWPTAERPMQESPYIPITGTWEDFRSSLSKNRRKSLGRRERRLTELGEITFTVADGTQGLAALLDEGFAIEASGWKGENGTAITSRPETLEFYTEISRWAADKGLLRLAFLKLDGRTIAFNLCLEDSRTHYALKPGHDEELNKYGPGALLEFRMVERSFALGLTSHELLGDPDELKTSFAGEHVRNRIEIQAFARSPRGVATRLIQTRGRAAARRILARS